MSHSSRGPVGRHVLPAGEGHVATMECWCRPLRSKDPFGGAKAPLVAIHRKVAKT